MYALLTKPNTGGTHMVNNHLSQFSQVYLESHVTEIKMRDTFGSDAEQVADPYDCDKGYSSEWYFEKDGEIFGIGFRWNSARVRCKGTPDTSKLEEFVDYIRKSIEKGA